MGILDEKFKKKFKGLEIRYNPDSRVMISKIVEKRIKEFTDKHRKEIEDKAENIHLVCGKAFRTFNNINDTIENAFDSFENGILRSLLSEEVKELSLGDNLFVQRYVPMKNTHHGLYVGHGHVVHYLLRGLKKTSMEVFADGAKIHKKHGMKVQLDIQKKRLLIEHIVDSMNMNLMY